jgi:lipoprotein-anchoring transpeptidase ErfK/SrfK
MHQLRYWLIIILNDKLRRLVNVYFKIILFVIFAHIFVLPADAFDVFKEYQKVIWINQPEQIGIAYEDGEKLFEFPIITGDDETTTDPGIYVVKLKDANYYSLTYDTPMPYSIFFDLKGKKAIHEGEVPPPIQKKELATHGCIHVEPPYIKMLYDWADEENTVVVISGKRTGD